MCAAPELAAPLSRAHQFLTFTTPPNLQAAVAYGLGKSDDYFETMRGDMQRSRDLFTTGLRERGFTVLDSQGTYFLNVDLAPLGKDDDVAFCKSLVHEFGVAAIPVSAFYAENPITSVARFCFAKRDKTLNGALERLENFARKAA